MRGVVLFSGISFLLTTGCSDRVLQELACEATSPAALLELGPHEFVSASLTQKIDEGWLVTVENYEEDILEIARAEFLSGSDSFVLLGRRTMWVDPCGESSREFPEAVHDWTTIRPGGPWLAANQYENYLVRDLDAPLTWEPLPESTIPIVPYEGDLLLWEGSSLLRWDPDEAARQPEELMDELAALVMMPTPFPQPQKLLVIDHAARLWQLDAEDGAAEWLADDVTYANAFLQGRWIVLQEDLRSRGKVRVRLLDVANGTETVLSEEATLEGWIDAGEDEGWLVLHEEEWSSHFETLFVHLPEGEVVRHDGQLQRDTTDPDPGGYAYLTYFGVTWRFDRQTGALSRFGSFDGELTVIGPWIYVMRDDPRRETFDLYRFPRDRPEVGLELMIEQSSVNPLHLRDGRWTFLRAPDAETPGDLVLLDPETREETTLAEHVPRQFYLWTLRTASTLQTAWHHARLGGDSLNIEDLVYVTLDGNRGGTLWHYRVPEE